MVTRKSKKVDSRLITVIVPCKIYDLLHSRRNKDGVTISHQVNAILAYYFSRKQ
jgi:hypothetical protein